MSGACASVLAGPQGPFVLLYARVACLKFARGEFKPPMGVHVVPAGERAQTLCTVCANIGGVSSEKVWTRSRVCCVCMCGGAS